MSAALKIDGLRTVLDTAAGAVRAVDGIDLELRPGECFALVGESGCGKPAASRAGGSSSTGSICSGFPRLRCARCAASVWR